MSRKFTISLLDCLYLLAAIVLISIIVEKPNMIDTIYFGIITFNYIKIKYHRWYY